MIPQAHNDLAEALSLDGTWDFALRGQSGQIRIPGCWEAQGFDRRAEGPATIQRPVYVPSEWRGRRIQLQFDAVSYYAEVQVNGVEVGTHTGSWTPFALDVTDAIRPGAENVIALTVFKPGQRFPLRESLAGFLPDVALMFGGIWQSARLVAFSGPALASLSIRSMAGSGLVSVAAKVHQGESCSAIIEVCRPDGHIAAVQRLSPGGQREIAATLHVPEPERWRPDHPALYTLEIRLEDEDGVAARIRRKFGFRELSHRDEQLLLDGTPICLRGALNWGWYPDILCPAPDEAAIRDEFRRVRALGFNLIKLCLYVPAPRYFEIADEEGMLLWLELPMWLPDVTPRLRQQAPIEYADILAAVHHHPSIVIYSLGCELNQAVDADLLGQLNRIARNATEGALICDNSGSGEAYGGLGFDFADFDDYHFYCDLHYFDPLIDHFRRDWRPPRPLIFGEFCDMDDFRDVAEIAAAHGGEIPWWLAEQNPIHATSFIAYSEQRQRMQALNLGVDAGALKRLSYQQSFMIRKTILEKVRARHGMGGYVVTGLRDTPLATSSLFDDFGRAKYAAEAFKAFNADTVLLLGVGRSRVWKHGGDRPAPASPYAFAAGREVRLNVILSHAGSPFAAPNGEIAWQVTAQDGARHASGEIKAHGPFTGGRPQQIGAIALKMPESDVALRLRLAVSFVVDGRRFANDWPLWVFPEVSAWPQGVAIYDPAGALVGLDALPDQAGLAEVPFKGVKALVTSSLSPEVIRFVRDGGSALLLQHGDRPLRAMPCPFWREGLKLIGDHPALNAFPHDGFADLQFYGLATDWAFEPDALSAALPDASEIRLPLRRLDARRFFAADYLIDARVGAGRLIASTLRFGGGTGDQPAGLRFNLPGCWLLFCLLRELLA